MKYYIIAGEASGDLHGSNLIKALHQIDPNAQCRVWGGDLMQTAGAHLVKHYKHTAYMGFMEVIKHLPDIWRNLKFCKQDMLQFQPDALILIDYPGFNLRIAPFAHQNHIKVFYYISPQVWAWKANRVHLMKQCIDKLYVILPFEPDFFKHYQWEQVQFVGHPLLDAIAMIEPAQQINNEPATTHKNDQTTSIKNDLPIVALLPGSRTQEIKRMLPIMLQSTQLLGNKYKYVIAAAPALPIALYEDLLQNYPNIELRTNQTYEVLSKAKAALVTSGTATLETALFQVPQVVCYKGNYLSYYIAKQLVKVKYISLVNLILDKPIIAELIQDNCTAKNIAQNLEPLLSNDSIRTQLVNDYTKLQQLLGGVGASRRTAQDIYTQINQQTP